MILKSSSVICLAHPEHLPIALFLNFFFGFYVNAELVLKFLRVQDLKSGLLSCMTCWKSKESYCQKGDVNVLEGKLNFHV